MTQKPSSNLSAFMAVGATIIAWKVAPASTSSDVIRTYGWIGAGMAALVAATLALDAFRSAEARPSPWRSSLGRISWALRPRAFMIAWAFIAAAVWMWGTPHLAMEYPPRPCTYAGLSGLHRMPPGAACPWWKWL